jgi:hypothetical protein
MIIVVTAIIEKKRVRNRILLKEIAISLQVTTRYPALPIRTFKHRSIRRYL